MVKEEGLGYRVYYCMMTVIRRLVRSNFISAGLSHLMLFAVSILTVSPVGLDKTVIVNSLRLPSVEH